MEGMKIFNEIFIVVSDYDFKEFEIKKQRVLNDVFQNVQERFGYLENDFVFKVVVVLDLDIQLKDEMELFIYGEEEV